MRGKADGEQLRQAARATEQGLKDRRCLDEALPTNRKLCICSLYVEAEKYRGEVVRSI